MLTFQEEKIRDVWDEFHELIRQHHASTLSYKRHEPFNFKRSRYEHYNDSGIYILFTARDKGVLVGYAGLYKTESMHSQLPIVTEDMFYIHPSHRGGRNALRFIQFVESQLRREIPVEVMYSCQEENTSGIKRLLQFLDYKPVIMVWSKYLPPRADSALPPIDEAVHVGPHTV